jgi:FG-GAP-like repeat
VTPTRRGGGRVVSALLFASVLVGAAPSWADLFLAPSSHPVGGFTRAIESADFDGDGRPDIVVWTLGGNPPNTPHGSLTVFLSNPDGTFRPPVSSEIPGMTALLAVADLDGDGRADVVVSAFGETITCWNNARTFSGCSALPGSAANLEFFAVADLNGDGRPDLVFSERERAVIDVLLGGPPDPNDRSHLLFAPPLLFQMDALPHALQVADMDGDGRPDVVVLTGDSAQTAVRVLYGDGTGGLSAGPLLTLGGSRLATSLAIGDLTGDGRPDIVTANSGSNTVTVIRNDRAGLSVAFDSGFVADPPSVRLADVNGDGFLDVVAGAAEASTVAVALGNGDGTLRPPQTYAGADFGNGSVAIADFDGDGLPDLASGGAHSLSIAVLRHSSTLHVDAGPDQAVLSAGAADVTLAATVVYSDPQVTLRWREGRHALGTGPVLVVPVSLGAHVLTVEATASDGALASDTVSVTVSGSFASQKSVDALAAPVKAFGVPLQEATARTLLDDVTNQDLLTSALLTFVQTQLDVTVGSRASSKDLGAAVLDLKAAGLTQADLDGLSAGVGAVVAGARKELMRAAIEGALARGETVALYMVPAARGGVLETVRGVVAAAIAGQHAPDRATRRAQGVLSRGDAELAAGNAGAAYRDFVDAYQTIARP